MTAKLLLRVSGDKQGNGRLEQLLHEQTGKALAGSVGFSLTLMGGVPRRNVQYMALPDVDVCLKKGEILEAAWRR